MLILVLLVRYSHHTDILTVNIGFVQAFPCITDFGIIEFRSKIRTMLADIPVKSFEALSVFYPVAARHEHDMIRLLLQLQGIHACLEEFNTVYFSLFELVDGTAESFLFIIEQCMVS